MDPVNIARASVHSAPHGTLLPPWAAILSILLGLCLLWQGRRILAWAERSTAPWSEMMGRPASYDQIGLLLAAVALYGVAITLLLCGAGRLLGMKVYWGGDGTPAVEHALQPTPHSAFLWRPCGRLSYISAGCGRG